MANDLLPSLAAGVHAFPTFKGISHGPLPSLKGSELWVLMLKVVYNGVIMAI